MMNGKTGIDLKSEVRHTCPKDYACTAELDFAKRRSRIAVTAVGVAAAILVLAVGCFIVPISELYNVNGMWHLLLRLLVILVLIAAYLAAYELLHSVVLKKLLGASTAKQSGFGKAFWFTSDDWFSPKAFFAAALLPTAAIFAVLLLLTLLLPRSVFWMVYIIQIINLAIPAPYYCLAYCLLRKKSVAALVRESGDTISVRIKE